MMRLGSPYGVVILMGLCATRPCAPQAITPHPDYAQQLQSPDMETRSTAYAALRHRRGAWSEPGMADALLHLVEREDELIASTLRESHNTVGVSDKYGEGYGEYYSDLLDTCLANCDKDGLLTELLHNARNGAEGQWSALELLQVVNNGRFTLQQRLRIDSTFVAAATYKGSFLVRRRALSALGEALQESDLPAVAREEIHRAAVAAAADEYPNVRTSALVLLATFGDQADIELLRRAAASDTATIVSGGRVTYPVRATAAAQLAKLKAP